VTETRVGYGGAVVQPGRRDDNQLSIQERLYPQLTCFGCGPANPKGLQLRSYPSSGVVTATFTPWPEHDNGFGFLNGGIISTILDCHSAAAVTLEADRQGWKPAPGVFLPYVTAALDVRFLRPTPLSEPLELWAQVTSAAEPAITANVEVRWDGKPRAVATAVWKRWRPR
jgi:acyl-coenzyme A thioesterase PaaI-like protein